MVLGFSKYTVILIIMLIFSCKQEKAATVEKSETKPNIIFILADDLGYGDLGSYGQEEIKTPNLDKMAQEGMRFTQHYAGATVCAPSRNCLMTGQHNGNAFIKSIEKPIPSDDVTVAEVLKQVGYKTALIGKWGLGNVGTSGYANDQGFDYSLGYYDQIRAHNFYTDYLMENGEKYPLKNKVIYIDDSTHYANKIGNAAVEKLEYSNDIFTNKALDYIDRADNDPFFLYLAYTIPHANNESWLINSHGMEVPELGQYSDMDWPEPKKAGAAMISRLDSYVGDIIKKLKEKGIDDNTIVFFSSDNGPHGEGGWKPEFFNSSSGLKGMKRDLYEGGIRVPLIVRWPEHIKKGESSQVCAFWDFMPTVCEITGATKPEATDGISYLPTLMGNMDKQKQHDYLYWEFAKKQAVRKDDWKAVKIGDSIALYDLKQDVKEEHNISKLHPKKVSELKKIMDQFPQ